MAKSRAHKQPRHYRPIRKGGRRADQPPRIMVTLDHPTYASLKRFSKASGMSMSAYVSQMLDEARESTDALSEAFEQARNENVSTVTELVNFLNKRVQYARQQVLDIQDSVKRRKRNTHD